MLLQVRSSVSISATMYFVTKTAACLRFSTRKPDLFRSTFRFEDITYSAAGNSFAFHGIAPEDDFGVQLVFLRA